VRARTTILGITRIRGMGYVWRVALNLFEIVVNLERAEHRKQEIPNDSASGLVLIYTQLMYGGMVQGRFFEKLAVGISRDFLMIRQRLASDETQRAAEYHVFFLRPNSNESHVRYRLSGCLRFQECLTLRPQRNNPKGARMGTRRRCPTAFPCC
jgi:hypothetical protein